MTKLLHTAYRNCAQIFLTYIIHEEIQPGVAVNLKPGWELEEHHHRKLHRIPVASLGRHPLSLEDHEAISSSRRQNYLRSMRKSFDLYPSLFYALWTSRSWDVPISVFRSDFNSTEEYWFDDLTPSFASRSKPGKQCDPHGESGFSYKGDTLDNCDVNQITLLVDLTAWSIEGEVVMNCRSLNDGGGTEDLVELAGVARFGVSVLSVKQTNFQRMAKSGAQDFRMFKI
ncbi:hypothetical protein DFP72DRAFT_845207 [Ephemerocybe angulata]|uniref:Uncharacterized protein n=1 Tax=Ephemerocybe angulata TaxID=980116 RepID=A0A8H6M812_9AGAR|nr:hypothetical protein DFP72DRAFT_845207 [Tulosesus angulatus]